jgi:hypothetical protein
MRLGGVGQRVFLREHVLRVGVVRLHHVKRLIIIDPAKAAAI